MGADEEEASALMVPVIDIGALVSYSHDADVEAALEKSEGPLRETVTAIRDAATEWGFFYITNHGLSEQQLATVQSLARQFFALPAEVKNTIRRQPENARGYFDNELTKNKKDWKEVFDYAGRQEDGPVNEKIYKRHLKDQNLWLEEETLPGFRQSMRDYFDSLESVSRRLLKVFAVGLGEKANFFDKYFQKAKSENSEEGSQAEGEASIGLKDHNASLARLNHYPVSLDPENTMGVYHHTDGGTLTVLLQDDSVNSLQVFHREKQKWVFVPPIKNTFVVNIGDIVQVWSNDKFIAPLHRVVSSETHNRISAPFFYLPSYDAEVKPVVVNSSEKPKYRPFNFGKFWLEKVVGNIVDLGEDLQITKFKINDKE